MASPVPTLVDTHSKECRPFRSHTLATGISSLRRATLGHSGCLLARVRRSLTTIPRAQKKFYMCGAVLAARLAASLRSLRHPLKFSLSENLSGRWESFSPASYSLGSFETWHPRLNQWRSGCLRFPSAQKKAGDGNRTHITSLEGCKLLIKTTA